MLLSLHLPLFAANSGVAAPLPRACRAVPRRWAVRVTFNQVLMTHAFLQALIGGDYLGKGEFCRHRSALANIIPVHLNLDPKE